MQASKMQKLVLQQYNLTSELPIKSPFLIHCFKQSFYYLQFEAGFIISRVVASVQG